MCILLVYWYTNIFIRIDITKAVLIMWVLRTQEILCCLIVGSRLNKIRIGTTDINPNTTAPTLSTIDVCASQDTPVGSTGTFLCGPTARYLVILLNLNEYLTLCEVEVYEGKHSFPS